ncbi:hypothetical protein PFFCH_04056 [Plasmodium falciparum FCH/4]|uniref:Uncharacterized protein n=1 Tax=Plasmodium falciparum FCH/4 TaxID=1036724 RepID=A0A024VJI5_PLAFA|nr:hypothetical protein PFFCH_04056 [Plasmodium falciparum FCH/4]
MESHNPETYVRSTNTKEDIQKNLYIPDKTNYSFKNICNVNYNNNNNNNNNNNEHAKNGSPNKDVYCNITNKINLLNKKKETKISIFKGGHKHVVNKKKKKKDIPLKVDNGIRRVEKK